VSLLPECSQVRGDPWADPQPRRTPAAPPRHWHKACGRLFQGEQPMAALAYFITTLRDRFEEKERGATAVEYGLIVALIPAIIVRVVAPLGTTIQAAFQDVVSAL